MTEEPEFLTKLIVHFLRCLNKQRRHNQNPLKQNALYKIFEESDLACMSNGQRSFLTYILYKYVLNQKLEMTYEHIIMNMEIDLSHDILKSYVPSNRDYRSALSFFVEKGLIAKGPVYRSSVYYINPFVLNNLTWDQNCMLGFRTKT